MIIRITERIRDITEVVIHQVVVKVADYYVGAGAVPLDTVQAKGDLIAGAGPGQVTRLPAGADGQFLVARSSAPEGMDFETISRPGDNIIINGDMRRVTRGGPSFAAVADCTFTLDRFLYNKSGSMVHTISQSTVVPTFEQSGHFSTNSMKIDCTTASASIAAGDYCTETYIVEGSDYYAIRGKTVTLSFWVRGTKTGTYCVAFRNNGKDRSYVAEYTIYSPNVEEKKSITLTLDQSGGTESYAEGTSGLRISWVLAAGSNFRTSAGAWQNGNYLATNNQVNACDSTDNDWHITQVKLEIGSSSTTYTPTLLHGGEEMACQRHCIRYSGADGNNQMFFPTLYAVSTQQALMPIPLPVEMCAVPTRTSTGSFILEIGYAVTSIVDASLTKKLCSLYLNTEGGLTARNAVRCRMGNDPTAYIQFEAELT